MTKKDFSWRTLGQEYVYSDERLKIRKDKISRPDGISGSYTVVERDDFVLIIPKIGDKFYLVEQDRYPISSRSLELPQGSVDPNEALPIAASRELEEEIGIYKAKLTLIGHHWLAVGHHTQGYSIFLAEGGELKETRREDSEADMETVVLTEAQIVAKIANGEIKDSNTIAAFAYYQYKQGKK